MTDFLSSLKIAATGLHAQNARMRVIAEDLAKADSAGKTPTDKPYQRRIPTFKAVMDDAAGGEIVKVGKIALDQTAFQERYEPGHPAADKNGKDKNPNVDPRGGAGGGRGARRAGGAGRGGGAGAGRGRGRAI